MLRASYFVLKPQSPQPSLFFLPQTRADNCITIQEMLYFTPYPSTLHPPLPFPSSMTAIVHSMFLYVLFKARTSLPFVSNSIISFGFRYAVEQL